MHDYVIVGAGSAGCVLAFWLLLRSIPNDVPGFVSALRLVFEALLAGQECGVADVDRRGGVQGDVQ